MIKKEVAVHIALLVFGIFAVGYILNISDSSITGQSVRETQLVIPVNGNLSCQYRLNSCAFNETKVLAIVNETNAHAELSNETNYPLFLCCNDTTGNNTINTSSSGTAFLHLGNFTNAHVELFNETNASINAYISASSNDINCSVQPTGEGSCPIGQTCMGTLAANSNAHIGNCSAYNITVCCGFGGRTTIYVPPAAAPASNFTANGSVNGTLNATETSYVTQFVTYLNETTGKKFVRFEGRFNQTSVNMTNLAVEFNDTALAINASGVSGVESNHTLFLNSTVVTNVGVRFCPSAVSLSQVNSSCSGRLDFRGPFPQTQSGITVSETAGEYVIDNVTGSGASILSAQNVSVCGTNITQDSVLNESLFCNTTGVIFGANNIALDCNGLTIRYDLAGNSTSSNPNVGVLIGSVSGVTVRNCVLIDGNSSGSDGYGVYAVNVVENNSVANVTVMTNGTSNNHGIFFNGLGQLYNNVIQNNTVTTTGNESSNIGINMNGAFAGSQIVNNTVSTNGSASNHGILSSSGAVNATISGNAVRTNGTAGGGNVGIFVQSSGSEVRNNSVFTNGINANYGIQLSFVVNNSVVGNVISTNGSNNGNAGILVTGSINSTVLNNTVVADGNHSNDGIFIQGGSANNTLAGNRILTFGTDSAGINRGLNIQNAGQNNTFANTTISTRGAGLSDGIFVLGENVSFVNISVLASTGYGVRVFSGGNNTFDNLSVSNTSLWILTPGSSTNNFTNVSFSDLNGTIALLGTVASGQVEVNRSNLDVGFNSAFLNSSNLSAFNKSAQITLRNLAFGDPRPLVDFEDDGSFALCNATQCQEVSYSGGVYVFNVSSFTRYTTEDSCPLNITSNTTLNQNVTCAGTAVVIESSNVTFDCAGNTIVYNTGGENQTNGINVTQKSNVTIKNCVLIDGNSSGSNNFGIYVQLTTNSSIINNTIQTNGTSDNPGISLISQVHNNTIANNTINGFGNSSANYGIVISSNGAGNVISGNNITTNGTDSNYGILLIVGVGNNTLSNNVIQTSGSSVSNHGIYVLGAGLPATGNNISGNSIRTGGSSSNGIIVDTNAHNTTAQSNNISTSGSSSYGISVVGSQDIYLNNTVLNNTVQWISSSGVSSANFSETFFIADNGSIHAYNFSVFNSTDVTRQKLNVTFNLAFLNSTNLSELNVSAQITLRSLSFIDPRPLVDFEDDGSFAVCGSPQCVEDSYSGGIFVMNVSSFTSYSTQETPQCPLNVTVNTTLTGNQACPGTAVNILTSNVVLDCAGFSINYSDSEEGFGVNISSFNNVTVKNCIIFQSNTSLSSSNAVSVVSSNNVTVLNSTVNATGSTSGGVVVSGASADFLVANSTVESNLSTAVSFSSTANAVARNVSIFGDTAVLGSLAQRILLDNISARCISGAALQLVTVSNVSIRHSNVVCTGGNPGVNFQTGFDSVLNNVTITSASGQGVNIANSRNITVENSSVSDYTFQSSTIFAIRNVTANESGIIFNAGNGTIDNSTFFGSSTAFSFINASNVTMSNSSMDGSFRGLRLTTESHNITVLDSLVSSGSNTAIEVIDGSSNSTFQRVRANVSSGSPAVIIAGQRISILESNATNAGSGLGLRINASNALIRGVVAFGGSAGGILLNLSHNSTVINTSANATSGVALQVLNTSESNVTNVTASSAAGTGILLLSSTRIIAVNSSGSSGSSVAVNVSLGNNNTLQNVSALGSSGIGLAVGSSSANNITGSLATSSTTAVSITTSSGNRLEGNVVQSTNSTAVSLVTSPQNTVRNNSVSGTRGIRLQATSSGNIIANNSVVNATVSGIDIGSSDLTVVENNTVVSGSTGLIASVSSHTLILNNSINGTTGIAVQSSCTNSSIINNSAVSETSEAIQSGCSNSLIENNTAIARRGGALVIGSSGSLVRFNSAINVLGTGVGIALDTSTQNNIFVNNTASGNRSAVFANLGDNNNTFINTTLMTNQSWISLTSTSTNVTFNNTLFEDNNGSIRVLGAALIAPGVSVNLSNLNVTPNKAFLNSTNLSFLNTSAQITLRGVALAAPVLIRDINDDGVFEYCPASVCSLESFASGALVFNVTGFTAFSSTGNISIDKLDSADPALRGGLLNYTIRINNSGNDTMFNVTVIETYPAGVTFVTSSPAPVSGNTTFILASLANNSVFDINITVNLSALANGTLLNNSYNVTWSNGLGQNTTLNDSETTLVLGAPAIVTSKSDSTDPVIAGEQLAYQILVNNTGDDYAFNVTVVDVYPVNVTFDSSSPAPAVANGTFLIGNLSPNQSFVINVTVNVSPSVQNGVVLNNTYNVTFANSSGQTAVVSNFTETTVTGIANVTLEKIDSPDPVNASNGTVLNYTIIVNVTNGIARNATVVEVYDANVTFISSEPAPAIANSTFALGNLTAEFRINISVSVTSEINNGTIITNRVNISWVNETNQTRTLSQEVNTTALSTVFNSNVTNSTVNNSNITDSNVSNSNITNSSVVNSTKVNSNVTLSSNTGCIVNGSSEQNVACVDSNITNSTKVNSNVTLSSNTGCFVNGSSETNVTCSNSNVTNSTKVNSSISGSSNVGCSVTGSAEINTTCANSNITNSSKTGSNIVGSQVQDSVNSNCAVNNSAELNSTCTNSNITNSQKINSTVAGSSNLNCIIINTTESATTCVDSNSSHSTKSGVVMTNASNTLCTVTGTTETTAVCVNSTLSSSTVIDSSVANSTKINSTLLNASIEGSNNTNCVVINSTETGSSCSGSTINNSVVINSTLQPGTVVENATIINGQCTAGTIFFNGQSFACPVALSTVYSGGAGGFGGGGGGAGRGGAGGGAGMGAVTLMMNSNELTTPPLKQADRVQIPLADGMHSLSIAQVSADRVTLVLQSAPQVHDLRAGSRMLADANLDGSPDLEIEVLRLGEGKVVLHLRKIAQQSPAFVLPEFPSRAGEPVQASPVKEIPAQSQEVAQPAFSSEPSVEKSSLLSVAESYVERAGSVLRKAVLGAGSWISGVAVKAKGGVGRALDFEIDVELPPVGEKAAAAVKSVPWEYVGAGVVVLAVFILAARTVARPRKEVDFDSELKKINADLKKMERSLKRR